MKRRLILLTLVALAVLAATGPRVRVDATDKLAKRLTLPVATPAALTTWAQDTEARFDDITPGAEKQIVFADPEQPAKTRLALVYLHGFSATRMETHPLTANVAAQLGANVYYARLRGHGRGSQGLSAARADQWLQDAREAYSVGAILGERVVVIGVSTGATLAAWLAEQPYADALGALVLVSPNFGLDNKGASILTLPWGLPLATALLGPTRSFDTINDSHARYWTSSYELRAAAQMVALVDYVNASPLETIRAPTLLVRSDRDTVIDIGQADTALERFASPIKATHIVTDSTDPWGHVIAGDIMSPESTSGIAAAIVSFVGDLDGVDHSQP